MLISPSLTGITRRVPNLYTLVMAAAKRARQIANEGKELQPGVREKAVSQAANDIYDGKTVVLE